MSYWVCLSLPLSQGSGAAPAPAGWKPGTSNRPKKAAVWRWETEPRWPLPISKQTQTFLAMDIPGLGHSWPADRQHKHFIDSCIQFRRDLIGVWRFLTLVSAPQQGCCCPKQPSLCHSSSKPGEVFCWEYTCGKQISLPARDVLTGILHALSSGACKAVCAQEKWDRWMQKQSWVGTRQQALGTRNSRAGSAPASEGFLSYFSDMTQL